MNVSMVTPHSTQTLQYHGTVLNCTVIYHATVLYFTMALYSTVLYSDLALCTVHITCLANVLHSTVFHSNEMHCSVVTYNRGWELWCWDYQSNVHCTVMPTIQLCPLYSNVHYRASKSCRRAFASASASCIFERKTGKTGTLLWFRHNLTKFLTVSQVLWHFKPIVLRTIFSQKILPAQKN